MIRIIVDNSVLAISGKKLHTVLCVADYTKSFNLILTHKLCLLSCFWYECTACFHLDWFQQECHCHWEVHVIIVYLLQQQLRSTCNHYIKWDVKVHVIIFILFYSLHQSRCICTCNHIYFIFQISSIEMYEYNHIYFIFLITSIEIYM